MRRRSKRYKALVKKLEKNKVYSFAQAIKLVKQSAKTKFNESVEVHIALGLDKDKLASPLRGTVLFPHSVGKKVKVAAFVAPDKEKEVKAAGADLIGGEELVNKIKETGKCNFDVTVAQPLMMRHLGKIAKILGPKGLMPSPKTETITPNPAKAVKDLKGGKVSFKADPQGCLHQIIGKVAFDEKKLQENFQTFIGAVKKIKPAKTKGEFMKSITVCSTMGPGIQVKI